MNPFPVTLSLAVFCFGGIVSAEPSPAVAPLLQPYVEKEELAGAVALVADRDGVLKVETVGYSDISGKEPMKEDALCWIASQTKPMTAVAVMMLVDEGKLSLDEPVETYLPEFKGQMVIAEKNEDSMVLRKPTHPIILREVLSHMSGLPFQSEMEKPTLDGLPLEAAVRSYAMTPLQTEPGAAYKYANAGINTAARILESVSGMKYEDFLQERLFNPLGMDDTTFWPTEEQLERLATTYVPGDKRTGLVESTITQLKYPLSDRQQRFPMPAGGLFSTAKDVAAFCRMMLNGGEYEGNRLISESSFNELTSRQTPDTVKNSYGLGFAVGPDWFGHGGAYQTNMQIYPEKGLVLVWMVQHSGGYPGEGDKAKGVFQNWALEKFGN